MSEPLSDEMRIAIVGMSARLPGAETLDAYWRNLCEGVETITFFSREDLIEAAVDPALMDQPNYVPARAILSDLEKFDSAFFGLSPREAALLDPQQRMLLECAWEAVECSGCARDVESRQCGVYAGVGMNGYFLHNILADRTLFDSIGGFQVMLGNDKDFCATRISYKLNLTGPSISVQTACSTSLVAVHLACQALLQGECDIALAGGCAAFVPQRSGYMYEPGMILSPDGHCRPFDAQAKGTVPGSGAAIVVLKRLDDALKDGDCIQALILGSAANNDGSIKVGYTAPSAEGQRKVISEALAVAGVSPDSIGYIEAHGTGTPQGDPIEFEALTQVFDSGPAALGKCALGSVKSNFGHLDVAAGIAGLLKAVLTLQNGLIPGTLHFERPNPAIDLKRSPFFVPTKPVPWNSDRCSPRRAGVSSFGIGGTNAHVVLEEPPARERAKSSRRHHAFVLSAKSAPALATAGQQLAEHLRERPECDPADVAFALNTGRRIFSHRRLITAPDCSEAIKQLEQTPAPQDSRQDEIFHRRVVFLFPGQGTQYPEMARGLYEGEPLFRKQIDDCAEILRSELEHDLRDLLFLPASLNDARASIHQTRFAQPALFAVEYSLARCLIQWDVRPHAMLGHSLGEWVAACIAGVMTLKDGLQLIAERARLMQEQPEGAMLGVPLSEAELTPYLSAELDLAAVNAPELCTVAGTFQAISALEQELGRRGVACIRLATSHAFHSATMEPVVQPLLRAAAGITLQAPQIRFISNATGCWITTGEATDPGYWARQLRRPVRCAEGLELLLRDPEQVLLEIGPGRVLSNLASRHPMRSATQPLFQTFPASRRAHEEAACLVAVAARLHMAGVPINWNVFHQGEGRRRLWLPPHPLQRERCWIEAAGTTGNEARAPAAHEMAEPRRSYSDWFYLPGWRRSLPPRSAGAAAHLGTWLLVGAEPDPFNDGEVDALSRGLAINLRERDADVVYVRWGRHFALSSPENCTVRPVASDDWSELLRNLQGRDRPVRGIIILERLLGLHRSQDLRTVPRENDETFCDEFLQLTALAQALGSTRQSGKTHLIFLSRELHLVNGTEQADPLRALVLGALRVIPQEYKDVVCRNIDMDTESLRDGLRAANRVMAEILTDSSDDIVVYRGAIRWIPSFEQIKAVGNGEVTGLRDRGVYLITGGLGGIGLTLAKHLAESYCARLILVSRSEFPDRAQWERLSRENRSRIGRLAGTLLEIEAFGGEASVVHADVAAEDQMANAIAESERRFGPIQGVIHAAGIPGGGVLAGKTPQTILAMMRAKVEGTLVLDRLFAHRQLDFLVLCSSVTGWLGGFGQADYCAANAFLNAYAAFKAYQEQPTFAIAWDTWREVGMAVETDAPAEIRRMRDDELRRYALTPSEGFLVFRQALRLGLPQVVISTRDFPSRYAGRNDVIAEALKKLGAPVRGPRHPRPDLATRFVPPRDDFERRLAEHWCENLGFSEIGAHDNYFDLGGDSLKGITLVSRLQKELGEIIHVTALFEAPTVAELATYFAKHYPATVPRFRASTRPTPLDANASRLDRNRVEQLHRQIGALPPYPGRPSGKNPRALFVLAPPRSGSTLLRVMLAGHPELFAPPELALLSFNTLRERKEAIGHAPSLLDGPIHALKQLRNCTAEAAATYMAELERRNLSCKECYLELQRLLQERLLVDKTPNYAYDLETLRRAEADFDQPLYVHLLRHPGGMIHSYNEAKLDLLLPRENRERVGLPRKQLAEAIWLISHENILRFLDEIPTDRHHRLKFEHLLIEPRGVMEQLCAFLGIEFQPGMLEPYCETRQRMTEGLHSNSRMLGDVNFHRHQGIEPEVADKWRSVLREGDLSELTQALAKRLGYETAREGQSENVAAPIPIVDRSPEDGTFAVSSGQRRLWFLDQLDGHSAVYHMPGALRIRGPLDVAALAECHREIIRRHETLRTAFTTRDGNPRQVIAPDLSFELPVIDLHNLPNEDRDTRARMIVKECTQRPFDLSEAPLLRAVVVRFSEEDHLWALTIHHIVSDGWSMSVFVREATSLYRAYTAGETRPLPDLPIQYVDYAAWQADWLRSDEVQSQISYWQKTLAATPPLLPLPYDRPRPAFQTNRGGRVRFALDARLSSRLKATARETNGTLFTTLLAGFAALLSRYSKLGDIVVGTPTAGRHRPEFEPLIGFFVNTLVLRIDLSADPTFRELLQQTRRVFLDAITHQDVPFEKLVEALQPPRDLRHTPVFQVMFGLRNIDTGELDWPGLALEPVDLDHETAAFDLTLLMKEVPTGLIGDFEYNRDLFDESTVQEFGRRFEILLRAWISRPDRRLNEIALTEPLERRSLLQVWNPGSPNWEATSGWLVEDLFAKQAARSPDAIAVTGISSRHDALTYAELNRYTDSLARVLARNGAGPEIAVGLCVERSPEMIVAILGILKAGAAYVPLDPAYPRERLEFMIRDAQIQVILAHDRFVSNLPKMGITVILADRIATDAEAVEGPPPAKALPENVAYLIYTSGSTGRPKAVVVERRSMAAFVQAAAQHYSISSADRVLQFASISFDAAIEEIFPTLISGGMLVLRDDEILDSTGSFMAACKDHQISVLDLPTAFWHRVAAELPSVQVPKSVRIIIIGGEATQTSHVEQWCHWGPRQIRVVNSYGPTETTVVATCCDLSGPIAQHYGPAIAPIGRGLPHVRIYLLDDHLHPVPPGVPGEICIGGGALARGYRGRPDLTAEQFWPDPFSNLPGARLYRTQDLARSRPDGTLEFLGRSDRQIKIRGFRVELDEIQSKLATHPAVAQAVAVVREVESGNKRLEAYVVPRTKTAISERALREWLEQRLPAYMIPASIMNLEAIPTTPQGKVDYKALPMDTEEFAPSANTRDSSDPRNEIEATLAQIWGEVLRIKRVGIHDNFFELGGDSILCLQVVDRTREAGLRLTSRQLFEQQTISQLATVVQSADRNGDHPAETGPFPLTPIQHWFFEQNFTDPHHFNQAVMLEVDPSVTAQQVTDAFRALVRRHDALRMRFTSGSGPVFASIEAGDATLVDVEIIELGGLQRDQQISEIEKRAAALQESLSLDPGPLTRMALFRLGATQPSRLLWIIHHLAVDGVSWRILLRDLEAALSATAEGQSRAVAAASISFGAWARLLTHYANSPACERELDYWLQLAPKRVFPLPRENDQGTNTNRFRSEANLTTVELEIEETTTLLRAAPAAYHCGIDDILVAALVRSFTEWTGERQLLLDLESHGRQELLPDVNVSGTVGWFTTVYPVCLTCDSQASVYERLRHVQAQLRQVPHHGFRYGLLRYLHDNSSVREKLAALPQADLLFNYFGQLDQALPESRFLLRRANENHGPTASPHQRRTHLIEINAWVSQGRLTAAWAFDRSLRRSTIEHLGSAFLDSLMELIAAACSSPPPESRETLTAGRVDSRQLAKVSAVLRKADQSRALQR